MMENKMQSSDIQLLAEEIVALIEQGRIAAGRAVNATLTLLYWRIGNLLIAQNLEDGKAVYGRQVIAGLATQLTTLYGSGWSQRQLFYCIQLSKAVPDPDILHTLCAKLSWSHIRLIIPMDDPLKRDFYLQMAQLENWSVRTLQERIQSMLYERTAISRKPEQTIINDLERLRAEQKLSPDLVFRDPYVLDFLGLKDTYSEKDLENAILVELERFIVEFGTDFAFMSRQKRITIDNRDYYIDLLFFHRRIKSLVAIDLKLGDFEAAYKGQMELYLRFLEKHLMLEGENPPIGLILCAGKNSEHVELLRLEDSNIRVAEYLTSLPPKKLLEAKLHEAIEKAREQISQRSEP
ncbi:MAG: PDDEXK nuclease domain-containing protein [Saprospiraceae bacterium]|nr:PDDEXK nuclease domain-containing protein [Saprospiraceae bacterium]